MKINKLVYIALTILLISGCTFNPPKKDEGRCISNTDNLVIEGRAGIRVQDRFSSGKFQMSFKKKYFKITINGLLNIGAKVIEEGPFGFKVNNISQKLDFVEWMSKEYGWYFPISNMRAMVLRNHTQLRKWNVQVMTRQGACLIPRLIKLSHKSKDIQIKLVLTSFRPDIIKTLP